MQGRAADILLANIQADVLMRFARELTGAVAPGGELVLSGILAGELDQVRAVFAAVTPDWREETPRDGRMGLPGAGAVGLKMFLNR